MAFREIEDSIRQLFSRLGAVERSSSQAGNITATARSTAPSGYLICDGSSVSRTEYSTLFAAIGTAYGVGDGSTTFGIPNLKGRVIVGVDAVQPEFDVRGEVGGSKAETLTTAQMPAHTHIQDAHNHTQNSHNHTQNAHGHTVLRSTTAGGGSNRFSQGPAPTSATTAEDLGTTVATNIATTATNIAATATNQNTGGGGAHNNLQPYMALQYLIKT